MSFLSRIRNFGISAWAGKDCRRSTLSEDIRNIQEELRIRHSVHTRDSSRMNIILNTLAITFKTNAAVALAQTFHRNLKRAFSRIISIYEEAFGKLEKKTRYHALLSSMGICLGARRASWYDDIPPRLRSLLESMIVNWREKYSCALPCVFPSNIKDNKAEIFLSWSYELLMHLDACSRLEDVTFRKGDLKRTQLLPLASHKMKFIQIDKSILTQCVIPFINDGKAKRGEALLSISDVSTCFPGIEKLRPKKASFQGSVKTDGVSVSVVFTRPMQGTRNEVQQWKQRIGEGREDRYGIVYTTYYTWLQAASCGHRSWTTRHDRGSCERDER